MDPIPNEPKLTGSDRRKARRTPMKTTGQLLICPSSSRTAPIPVEFQDVSATGVGIVHSEALRLGQKFVVKEQSLSKRPTLLYTVVRSDRIDEGRYSIGLHATSLMPQTSDSTVPAGDRRGNTIMLYVGLLLLMAGLAAARAMF